MKILRKFTFAALAVTMALCSNVICSAEGNDIYAEAIEDTGINFSAEGIVIGNASDEDVIGLNTELNYLPEIQTYGAFQGSDYIYHSDTLTSDDAVDFYLFTLSGTKTALLTLQTTADYIAIICPYNPATGDIDVSTSYPYVLKGESRAFVDVNNDSQNTFCLVVMNLGSEYGSAYTVGMNATNPAGATVIEYASSNLSRAVCRYSNGYVYSNGNNITLAAADFIVNKMNGTVFEDQYKSGSPSYQVANVGVVSNGEYIEGDTLYYGSYTSTNDNINLKNNLKHSSDEVIFVPINGYTYLCTISGTYIPYQSLKDIATGFLVYDLKSGKVIDWMSSCNIFYASPGYFTYKYSYSIYAELPFSEGSYN